jgi:hypothetical protein
MRLGWESCVGRKGGVRVIHLPDWEHRDAKEWEKMRGVNDCTLKSLKAIGGLIGQLNHYPPSRTNIRSQRAASVRWRWTL